MKFVRLLLKNVFRNKRRSLLTISSISVSLFLIATLLTLLSELENPPETPHSAVRVITRHSVSLASLLPISYGDKIAALDGVEAAYGSMWFGGVYKDPSNFFAQFAVQADGFFEVMSDLEISEEEKQAFHADRAGAIAGRNLAERFGWRLGERIHLQGTIFPFDPELTLRGIYEGGGDDANSLYFHWDYLNEAVQFDAIGTFTARTASVDHVPIVSERVDEMFRNTSAPTKTESEKAFLLGFVSMMGNVRLLIQTICLVVSFTIILVAANTMAMSIRERVREIGIMKALGFRSRQILGLLLGESVMLALIGALLGALAARILFSSIPIATVTAGMLQRFHVNTTTLAVCVVIGAVVGLLAAGWPAARASRRPVVEALRNVA